MPTTLGRTSYRVAEKGRGSGCLLDSPIREDNHVVGHDLGNSQVVGDEDAGEADLLLQSMQEVQDLGLN